MMQINIFLTKILMHLIKYILNKVINIYTFQFTSKIIRFILQFKKIRGNKGERFVNSAQVVYSSPSISPLT